MQSYLVPNANAGAVALVTGGGTGIGRAIVDALAASGAQIAICGRRAEPLEETRAAIEAAGGSCLTTVCDVREPEQVDAVMDAVAERYGRLDVLVNNAGDMLVRKPVAEIDDVFLARMIDLNVRSVVEGSREAVAAFRRQGGGGAIINVSSVAARTGGGAGSHVYAGCKGFVSTFTRSLAKEVAREGIRVNAVGPGIIATALQDRVTPPDALAAGIAMVPMRRAGIAEDCVGAFLYLASPQLSGYVTGEVIEVNGGLLMD
jgi:3-oxoacyl-[acyl-carrier protein] reductase